MAAGLQLLAVNGWQADRDVPRAEVIVIERLASGQLTAAQAASWLVARLIPDPGVPAGQGHRRAVLPARSPVAQIARAVRRRYRRRTRPRPFLIRIGLGGMLGGIITPVTEPMAFTGHASKARRAERIAKLVSRAKDKPAPRRPKPKPGQHNQVAPDIPVVAVPRRWPGARTSRARPSRTCADAGVWSTRNATRR